MPTRSDLWENQHLLSWTTAPVAMPETTDTDHEYGYLVTFVIFMLQDVGLGGTVAQPVGMAAQQCGHVLLHDPWMTNTVKASCRKTIEIKSRRPMTLAETQARLKRKYTDYLRSGQMHCEGNTVPTDNKPNRKSAAPSIYVEANRCTIKVKILSQKAFYTGTH